MKWKKSSAAVVKLFDELCPPTVDRKKMFGYPCAFAGGTFAFGLHEDNMVFRLGDDEVAELVKAGGAPFSPMPGRTMSGWGMIGDATTAKPALISKWIGKSITHALKHPKAPKKKKAPGPKKARK
jgi:hypothetical protein